MYQYKLAQSFSDAIYRYIDGAKIAVNTVFGAPGLGFAGLATGTDSAFINEKERSKAASARAHQDLSVDKKRNFHESRANRDAYGHAGPHISGSPKVFKD